MQLSYVLTFFFLKYKKKLIVNF